MSESTRGKKHRKEREEREIEREERRRKWGPVRSRESTALDKTSAKRLLDLELENEAMDSKVEPLTNQLMSLKRSTNLQFKKMKQVLEAERKKDNVLVEHINLF